MNNNLLIIGAGVYALVAQEIAMSMGCFDKIAFADDMKTETVNGIAVVGTSADIPALSAEYGNMIVAIGNPSVRRALIRKVERAEGTRLTTLISPHAYLSPSARVMKGSIIEPMAVVHTGAVISTGCIISAGAVVNHASVCAEYVHIDCNATVGGNTLVPSDTKVKSGEVYEKKDIDPRALFDHFKNS